MNELIKRKRYTPHNPNHKYLLRNTIVFYYEYGSGAYLINEEGIPVADFDNHLDAEFVLDHLERVK